jgi:NADH-quinone oxidoreductase subunit M
MLNYMFVIKKLLFFILIFPIIGVLLLFLVPKRETRLLKFIALNSTCFSFIGSLLLWGGFNKFVSGFQFLMKLKWFPLLMLNFTLGVDGISLFFIVLTTLLIPICLLASWNTINYSLREFLIAFLFLNSLLIGVFCVLDLLFFYIFFESVLIPMFLIIGIWGSRERKILAAYYFFCILYLVLS